MRKQSKLPSEYHLLSTQSLKKVNISALSAWTDMVWNIAVETPGHKFITLSWDFEVGDGKRFGHLSFEPLRDAAKRFVWSLLFDPREIGRARKPLTLTSVMTGLRFLIRWMVDNNYTSFEQIDVQATKDYLQDLPRRLLHVSSYAVSDEARIELTEETESVAPPETDLLTSTSDDEDLEEKGPLSFPAVVNRVHILWLIYWQRHALIEAGIPISMEAPFDGKSTYSVAKATTPEIITQIPPVPDEAVVPILTECVRLLGTAVEDVTAALTATIEAFEMSSAPNYKTRSADAVKVLVDWKFSVLPGESTPWAPPLAFSPSASLPTSMHGGYTGEASHTDALRDLVCALRDACVITIQCLVGLRIGEICGIEAGTNRHTGLPRCIEVARSRSGLEELFYLSGRLAKGRPQVAKEKWLLGSRPVGSMFLPLPVRALCALEKLYAPWRNMTDCTSLVLGFSNARGLPRTGESLTSVTTAQLILGQKAFISSRVDLSALSDFNRRNEDLRPYRESKGHCIRPHQWRKTFAHYVLETRASLLVPLSQHFKHMSIAMTEQGYRIADSYIRRAMEAATMSATISFIMEAAHGKRITGHMATLIGQHRSELLKMTRGDADAAYRRVEAWVKLHDIRIFFHEHSKCLMSFNPLAARCHQLSETQSWRNTIPNIETREPSVCTGCPNHVIDGEHAIFWLKRYRDNTNAFEHATKAGVAKDFRVMQERARQAAVVLRHLGIDYKGKQ